MKRVARQSVGLQWGRSALLHGVLLGLMIISMFPLLWVVCASFKRSSDIIDDILIPWSHLHRLTLDNFRALFATRPFGRWMCNALFVSTAQTTLAVLLSSLGGFALAKYRFRGKAAVVVLMLATALVPGQALLTGSLEWMYRLGWVDSFAAVIVPGAVSVLGMLLFRQAMLGVPDELLDAARIDGCSELRVWWMVALPMVRPMTAAFTLLYFVGAYNAYLWPQIILQDPGKYTLPVGLASMLALQGQETQYGILMAATALGVLPVMALFLALQRDFVSGLATGAIKG